MENRELLRTMVELGYNDLYLELESESDIYQVLQDNFGMTEENIANNNFDVANKVLQVSLDPDINITSKKKVVKEKEDNNPLERTEKYQLWMAILMISLFGVAIMLLIFQPIPDMNNDLLVVLATWLGKDVSLIIQYHHGTSYSSLLKTKSMIRNDNESFASSRQANRHIPR